MHLVGDRFIVSARVTETTALDLASNRSIWLRVTLRGCGDECLRWASTCDDLFQREPSTLIDYGLLGVSERFEAWQCRDAAECAVRERIERGDDAAGSLSVVDGRAIAAVTELFQAVDSRRGQAAALWSAASSTREYSIRVLARLARVNGFIPIAAEALEAHASFLNGRSLCVIDEGRVLIPAVRAVLANPRAHVYLSVGVEERPGVRSLALGPLDCARYVRADAVRTASRSRVAEQAALYTPEPPCPAAVASDSKLVSRSAKSDELALLRRQVNQSKALLASGRHAPGLRLLRRTTGALARRHVWSDAGIAALALAAETMKRGRSRETIRILNDAGEYAGHSNDAGLLLEAALLSGLAWIDAVRLDEAERVLTAAITSARSIGDRQRASTLSCALARCLFWRADYAGAAAYVDSPLEAGAPDRLALRRSRLTARLAAARGDTSAALAALDNCRRRVPPDALDLHADVEDTTAFVKLLIGDLDAVDHHAALSVSAARAARRPMRVLSARLHQAEADRRRLRKQSDEASTALRRLAATATPLLRARWDLLAALSTATDATAATARQVSTSGLKALELFSGTARVNGCQAVDPIVGDVVAILSVCQRAEDERALVRDVCASVRQRLRAAAVSLVVPAERGWTTVASDGSRIDVEIGQRAFGLGTTISPAQVRERIESAALVEYGGKAIAALCARWTIGTTEDLSRAGAVLSMAAAAASTLVAAFLARQTPQPAGSVSELLGVTTRMVDLRREIDRAAAAPFSVLIQGESGSGKELVARGVHRASARRDRAFTTLNCAALPDDLVEAELFGHARGAFTGAVAERPGVFEEANGGTLFLDEVGELSPRAQAKVLRVIQEGELRRVGENIPRRVDVRIVAATNRDLRGEVESGGFRLDLWYRLDVLRIVVPPLRDRPEDITVLIDHFWNEATQRIGSRSTLAATTRAALTQYGWPGNVRELQNVLAALAVRSPRRGVIPPSALPAHFAGTPSPDAWRLQNARRTFEEQFIRAALVRTGGHRGRAADELGVSRQGLAKLMTRLGIT